MHSEGMSVVMLISHTHVHIARSRTFKYLNGDDFEESASGMGIETVSLLYSGVSPFCTRPL